MSTYIRSFNRDFDGIVTLHGDRPAFIPAFDEQAPLSYAQINVLVQRHLAWFRSMRLKPGDRIGALMPNSMEMLTLFFACLRGGYHFAPLACDTSSVEAESWVKLIQPARIVVGNILPDPVRAGLRHVGAECVDVIVNGRFDYLPDSATIGPAPGAKLFLFTSGTTGQPKAIVLDGDRLWSAGHAFLRHHGIGFDSRFRIWNYLPQSYLGGLFNLCLIPMTVAGSVVVDESFSGKTFLSFWQTVDRYDVSALWLVPTIVRGLLAVGERTRRHELKSYKEIVRVAFIGTAPIEEVTKRRFEDLFGIPLLENYALSETTFLTSEVLRTIPARVEGSVGAPLPWVEFSFRPAAAGEADAAYQEILVKTPFLLDGYLEDDSTISPVLEDGWFATGDLGYLDAKGQLIVTGRCKDIIKKGGQFVSLREIEVVVMRHPLVKNAAATVCPHPFYGESYRLFVQMGSGATPTSLDDVRNYLFAQVAKYKWPDQIEAVDDFPYTGSGKVRKFLLKAAGAS